MCDYTANCGSSQGAYDGPIVPSKYGYTQEGLTRKIADITDGTSNTMMVGEKFVVAIGAYDPNWQRSGGTYGPCNDDQGYVDGWDNDTLCSAGGGNSSKQVATSFGMQVELPRRMDLKEADNDECGLNFGSIHATGFLCAFCDGTVHAVPFDISPDVWYYLCKINDGQDPGFAD